MVHEQRNSCTKSTNNIVNKNGKTAVPIETNLYEWSTVCTYQEEQTNFFSHFDCIVYRIILDHGEYKGEKMEKAFRSYMPDIYNSMISMDIKMRLCPTRAYWIIETGSSDINMHKLVLKLSSIDEIPRSNVLLKSINDTFVVPTKTCFGSTKRETCWIDNVVVPRLEIHWNHFLDPQSYNRDFRNVQRIYRLPMKTGSRPIQQNRPRV